MIHITSLHNLEIKHIVRLHEAKERRKHKKCIIEGLRTITTALEGGMKLDKLFVTQDLLEQAKNLASTNIITTVTPEVMKKISTAVTPSGILGVFIIPTPSDISKISSGLVLAQISEPGNMGTLIRTAAACAIKTVIIIEGCDPWAPKTIQASAGNIAFVNIFELDWDTLIKTKKNLKLNALVVSNGIPIEKSSVSKELLVVGNEAHGLPKEWQKQCETLVTLPMPGGTESLNAATAGSIAMYMAHVAKAC